MPKRPIQHQIATQAAVSVSAVWAKIGAAVESIRQDYGEDLLVQPCFEDEMDDSRIWVQVKGTADAADLLQPDGTRNVRVPNRQALRWARTADMLAVVCWDVINEVGWFAYPEDSFDEYALSTDPDGHTNITVSSKQGFDIEAARILALRARLNHAARLIRNRKVVLDEMQLHRDAVPPEHLERQENSIYSVIFDIMLKLGIIEQVPVGDNPDGEFRLRLTKRFRSVVTEHLPATDESSDSAADGSNYYDMLGRAVLAAVVESSNKAGMEETLIYAITPAAMVMLKGEAGDSWAAAFPDHP